jgi:hypothetical protein
LERASNEETGMSEGFPLLGELAVMFWPEDGSEVEAGVVPSLWNSEGTVEVEGTEGATVLFGEEAGEVSSVPDGPVAGFASAAAEVRR